MLQSISKQAGKGSGTEPGQLCGSGASCQVPSREPLLQGAVSRAQGLQLLLRIQLRSIISPGCFWYRGYRTQCP